jgi:hypothetical protein
MRATVGLDAEHALAGDARCDAAHRAGGARHTADFAEQRSALEFRRFEFGWRRGVRHAHPYIQKFFASFFQKRSAFFSVLF